MKRRASGHGFLMSLFLNMIFQSQWLLAAVVMLVLHELLRLPMLFFWGCLAVWVLWSLAVTLFVSWAAGTGDSNPVPGGQRTSERLKRQSKLNKND